MIETLFRKMDEHAEELGCTVPFAARLRAEVERAIAAALPAVAAEPERGTA